MGALKPDQHEQYDEDVEKPDGLKNDGGGVDGRRRKEQEGEGEEKQE